MYNVQFHTGNAYFLPSNPPVSHNSNALNTHKVSRLAYFTEFSIGDFLLSFLVGKHLLKYDGCLNLHNPLFFYKLPSASTAAMNKLKAILKRDFEIKLMEIDLGIRVSAFEILTHMNEWLKKEGYAVLSFEFVGTGVITLLDAEFLEKGWKVLNIDIKQVLGEQGFEKLLEEIQITPSDYDIRILLPGDAPFSLLADFKEELINFVSTKIPNQRKLRKNARGLLNALKKKNPEKYTSISQKDLAYTLIKEFGFSKLFASNFSQPDQYAIGAIGNGSDLTFEIMLVKSLERSYQLGLNSLKVNMSCLIESDNMAASLSLAGPQIDFFNEFYWGWQAFCDIQTGMITPYHDQTKLKDKDWARYFSYLIKGKRLFGKFILNALWNKVLESSYFNGGLVFHISKLLVECFEKHHKNDPYAAVAIMFNVRLFLIDKIENEKITSILNCLNPVLKLAHETWKIVYKLIKSPPKIFKLGCGLIELGAFLNLCVKKQGPDVNKTIKFCPLTHNGVISISVMLPASAQQYSFIFPLNLRTTFSNVINASQNVYFEKFTPLLKEVLLDFFPKSSLLGDDFSPLSSYLTALALNLERMEELCFQANSQSDLVAYMGLCLLINLYNFEKKKSNVKIILELLSKGLFYAQSIKQTKIIISSLSEIFRRAPYNFTENQINTFFSPIENRLMNKECNPSELNTTLIMQLASLKMAEFNQYAYSMWCSMILKISRIDQSFYLFSRELIVLFLPYHYSLAAKILSKLHRLNQPNENFIEILQDIILIWKAFTFMPYTHEVLGIIDSLFPLIEALEKEACKNSKSLEGLSLDASFLILIERLLENKQFEVIQNLLKKVNNFKYIFSLLSQANGWTQVCKSLMEQGGKLEQDSLYIIAKEFPQVFKLFQLSKENRCVNTAQADLTKVITSIVQESLEKKEFSKALEVLKNETCHLLDEETRWQLYVHTLKVCLLERQFNEFSLEIISCSQEIRIHSNFQKQRVIKEIINLFCEEIQKIYSNDVPQQVKYIGDLLSRIKVQNVYKDSVEEWCNLFFPKMMTVIKPGHPLFTTLLIKVLSLFTSNKKIDPSKDILRSIVLFIKSSLKVSMESLPLHYKEQLIKSKRQFFYLLEKKQLLFEVCDLFNEMNKKKIDNSFFEQNVDLFLRCAALFLKSSDSEEIKVDLLEDGLLFIHEKKWLSSSTYPELQSKVYLQLINKCNIKQDFLKSYHWFKKLKALENIGHMGQEMESDCLTSAEGLLTQKQHRSLYGLVKFCLQAKLADERWFTVTFQLGNYLIQNAESVRAATLLGLICHLFPVKAKGGDCRKMCFEILNELIKNRKFFLSQNNEDKKLCIAATSLQLIIFFDIQQPLIWNFVLKFILKIKGRVLYKKAIEALQIKNLKKVNKNETLTLASCWLNYIKLLKEQPSKQIIPLISSKTEMREVYKNFFDQPISLSAYQELFLAGLHYAPLSDNSDLLRELMEIRLEVHHLLPSRSAFLLHYQVDRLMIRALLRKKDCNALKQCFILTQVLTKSLQNFHDNSARALYCKSLIDILLACIPVIDDLSYSDLWILEPSVKKILESLSLQTIDSGSAFHLTNLIRFLNAFQNKGRPLLLSESIKFLIFIDSKLTFTFSKQDRQKVSNRKEDILEMFRLIKKSYSFWGWCRCWSQQPIEYLKNCRSLINLFSLPIKEFWPEEV